MDSYVPLLVATLVFAVYIVFRFRPVFSRGGKRSVARAALRDAKARLANAKTAQERALCLGDAADASASSGSTTGAVGYYMRAMRLDPYSVELVERAAASLTNYPRSLETLLWRRLGAEVWTGPTAPPAHAAIRHLAALYARAPLRHSVRARAFQNALAALIGESIPQVNPGQANPGQANPEQANPEPKTGSAARDDGSAPANP